MSNNGDDFEDEFDPSETEEFDDEQAGDEDWDEYEDQSGEENLDDEDSSEPAPRKKSGSFNKILIGGGVLVVAGMIVMQMGKGGSAPAPAPMPVTAEAPAPAPAEQAPVGMLASADEMAKMAAMAKHNTPAAEQAEAPSPASAPTLTPVPAATPVAGTTPAAPETIPVATPKEVPNVPTPPMPAPVTAPEKVAEKTPEKTPEKLAETPVTVPTPVLDATPAPVKGEEAATRMPRAQDMMLKSTTPPDVTPAPAPTPSGNADTAALNMKMDTILSRLTALEGEVSTLKQKPDATEQVAELKSSIEAVEKKMSSGVVTSKPAKKAVAEVHPVAAPTSALPEVETQPEPQILGASDSEPEAHPVAASSPAPKKAVEKPVKVSTLWVLKGAQPGQATVAKAGESDSRTVHVGDTLPGIGRVTAVEYLDGRWAVIGTQGRINQ